MGLAVSLHNDFPVRARSTGRPYHADRIVVGHTIHAFRDGGMERGILNLINYGDWERFAHVILCLTEAGAFAEQITAPRCELVEFHKREGNDLSLPVRIAAAARQYHVDILHARGWPTLVETAFGAWIARVPHTIYGFHGKTMQDLQGGTKRRLIERLIIRGYDEVVTLNSLMRVNLVTSSGLSERRIRVIANGVDVETFCPQNRDHLRAEFGIPENRFVIGNVARLDPVKNQEVILRALARLHSSSSRPYLLIVGEGQHREALECAIRQLDLKEDVQLLGYSHRIPELLNCMDLYIQSSFYEGFSNTILEAMACGLPVLASDVGGTADLFSADPEGMFFAPDDVETLAVQIWQLQQNPAARAALAGRARAHVVENFSVQAMVRGYEALYFKLMTDH